MSKQIQVLLIIGKDISWLNIQHSACCQNTYRDSQYLAKGITYPIKGIFWAQILHISSRQYVSSHLECLGHKEIIKYILYTLTYRRALQRAALRPNSVQIAKANTPLAPLHIIACIAYIMHSIYTAYILHL